MAAPTRREDAEAVRDTDAVQGTEQVRRPAASPSAVVNAGVSHGTLGRDTVGVTPTGDLGEGVAEGDLSGGAPAGIEDTGSTAGEESLRTAAGQE